MDSEKTELEETLEGTDEESMDREFRAMEEEAAGEVPASRQRAIRFYDRIRGRIGTYIERRGSTLGKARDFLFLVPDVFILLWRLSTDRRVTTKNKMLLGTALAYYVFPLDIMPEAILGPIGFLDDLVMAVYVLNKMLADTDEEILREHWSGSEDVLGMIRRVLLSADSLVASDVLRKIKKVLK